MTRAEIFTSLSEIICLETGYAGEIREHQRIIEDIGADSLNLISIVSAAEATFGVAIPDEALVGLQRVGDAVDLVESTLVG